MDIILLIYCIGLVWLFVRSDSDVLRLTGLASGDELLESWRILHATTFSNRRIGLLNHSSLDIKSGLLLRKSRKVHTVGMLFSIDLVFLNKSGVVLDSKTTVAPGLRGLKGPRGTAMVLELAAGTVGRTEAFSPGATLTFPVLVTERPAASSSP